MSTTMKATVLAMRGLTAVLPKVSDEKRLAKLVGREYPEPAPVPKGLAKQYEIETLTVDGFPVVRLTPRTGATGQQLVYTHGGAYVNALIKPHWAVLDRVGRGNGVTITLPLYGLAPEHAVDAAYPFLRTVYEQLVAAHGAEKVTLAGDSAGGGLALGQAIAYRDAGVPAPRQVVLFAPWLDLTMSHPDVPSLVKLDPMLKVSGLVGMGALWAGGLAPTDPLLSPQTAELHDLPPVHVFQGGHDLFAADAKLLHERLVAVGNPGTFTFEPDGFHVYMAATWAPESKSSLAAVNQLLRPPA